MQASWLDVRADTVQIDAAGIIQVSGQAPRFTHSGVDAPTAGMYQINFGKYPGSIKSDHTLKVIKC